jgi:tripartite ATP-independent transporter DctP family solute receptor
MKDSKTKAIVTFGRRRVLQLGAAASGAALLGISAPALAQRAKVFRFGHMLPADTLYHKACVTFGDQVAELSGGKMKVDVYPASQLGSIPEMLSNVKSGSLSIGMAVPAWFSNFMKPMDAFTLPYIVGSSQKLRRALDGKLGEEVASMSDAAGFKALGSWLIGARHIVNKQRPVNKPADCQGLKIRCINSQVYIQSFRALGANTVAMDPSELYVALQQGVVDGFEYPIPDLLSYKLYEVVKYLSLDAHTTDFFQVVANKALWDGFATEQQEIFGKAMKTAMEYQWTAQPKEIDSSLAKLKTLMQVNEISAADKALFIEATRPVYAQFEASIGKNFLDLAIKELG